MGYIGIKGLYRDTGKENRNYYNGLYMEKGGYIEIMEKRMETCCKGIWVIYRDNGKKMETAIYYTFLSNHGGMVNVAGAVNCILMLRTLACGMALNPKP